MKASIGNSSIWYSFIFLLSHCDSISGDDGEFLCLLCTFLHKSTENCAFNEVENSTEKKSIFSGRISIHGVFELTLVSSHLFI
jgi:hypothetical protein